jgi:hypothetical protein
VLVVVVERAHWVGAVLAESLFVCHRVSKGANGIGVWRNRVVWVARGVAVRDGSGPVRLAGFDENAEGPWDGRFRTDHR